MVDRRLAAAIDLVEAGYDLNSGANQWFPQLLRAGEQFFRSSVADAGSVVFGGSILAGVSELGAPVVTQLCPPEEVPDGPIRYAKAMMTLPPGELARSVRTFNGRIRVLSEIKDEWPHHYRALKAEFGDWNGLRLRPRLSRRVHLSHVRDSQDLAC